MKQSTEAVSNGARHTQAKPALDVPTDDRLAFLDKSARRGGDFSFAAMCMILRALPENERPDFKTALLIANEAVAQAKRGAQNDTFNGTAIGIMEAGHVPPLLRRAADNFYALAFTQEPFEDSLSMNVADNVAACRAAILICRATLDRLEAELAAGIEDARQSVARRVADLAAIA